MATHPNPHIKFNLLYNKHQSVFTPQQLKEPRRVSDSWQTVEQLADLASSPGALFQFLIVWAINKK
jgi:hypothetical protein